MVTLLAMGAAFGMEVQIARTGGVKPFLFVDGVAQGEVTKKKNAELVLDDGPHELWFSWDPDGNWEICHGLVTGPTLVMVGPGLCSGLQKGEGAKSRLREATIAIQPSATLAFVAIDGGEPIELPKGGVRATAIAATHIVRVTTVDGAVLCSGKVSVDRGETAKITVGVQTCTGFDDQPRMP